MFFFLKHGVYSYWNSLHAEHWRTDVARSAWHGPEHHWQCISWRVAWASPSITCVDNEQLLWQCIQPSILYKPMPMRRIRLTFTSSFCLQLGRSMHISRSHGQTPFDFNNIDDKKCFISLKYDTIFKLYVL